MSLKNAFEDLAVASKQDTGNTSLASIDSKITAVNTGAVTVSSSALPSGAATSANQSTANASLSNIDTNTKPGLTGTGTDTTLTLTSASTSYQVPASPPTSAYLLMLYNSSDTDMYITFTSTTSGGAKLAVGQSMTVSLGASQNIYAYCGSSGKVLNVSSKVF